MEKRRLKRMRLRIRKRRTEKKRMDRIKEE